MKKILIAATIIVLAIVVVIQTMRIRRLSPPEAYEYTFREDIDMDYFDAAAVKSYFDGGYEAGSFAREMWKNRGLNVRLPESDDLSNRIAVKRYNHLLAYSDSLGARLSQSLKLKAEGFTNADIRKLQHDGISKSVLKIEKQFGASELKLGDQSKGVYKLQNLLNAKGYTIPNDGYFFTETVAAVKDFQRKATLYPSGVADLETLEAILR